MSHHIYPLKNNYENYREIYYNPLRVVNGETSRFAMSPHAISPSSIEKIIQENIFL
jgi:hypothetical protein